jgi:hypothetical protein
VVARLGYAFDPRNDLDMLAEVIADVIKSGVLEGDAPNSPS